MPSLCAAWLDYAVIVATAPAQPSCLATMTAVSDAIQVSDTVRVPASALTVRAVRASGPGGQNVNKVATKIDPRVELDAIEGLPEPARERLRTLARHRLDADGRLVVTSQVTRNPARPKGSSPEPRRRRMARSARKTPSNQRPSLILRCQPSARSIGGWRL